MSPSLLCDALFSDYPCSQASQKRSFDTQDAGNAESESEASARLVRVGKVGNGRNLKQWHHRPIGAMGSGLTMTPGCTITSGSLYSQARGSAALASCSQAQAVRIVSFSYRQIGRFVLVPKSYHCSGATHPTSASF
jgi:hypothetical protein